MRVNGAAGGGKRGSGTAEGLLLVGNETLFAWEWEAGTAARTAGSCWVAAGKLKVHRGKRVLGMGGRAAHRSYGSLGQVMVRRGRWQGPGCRRGAFSAALLHAAQLSKAGTGNVCCGPQLRLLLLYTAREAYVFPPGPLLSSQMPFLFQITLPIGSQNKWNRL